MKLQKFKIKVKNLKTKQEKIYTVRAKNAGNAQNNAYCKFCDEFNAGKDLEESSTQLV